MFNKKIIFTAIFSLLLNACASTSLSVNKNNGQSESNESLGKRYLFGRGMPQNDQLAFTYFKRAADYDNNAFAQNEVAYLYAVGKGTEKNQNAAFEYYQKAANQGLASAQYNLSLLYKRGIGTPQNGELAKEWLTKAANNGFAPAKKALLQP